MEMIRAARNAMATRFEMVLHGDDAVRLRAAADTAFQEIERLHAQLSLYLPSSEVCSINSRAARRAVRVEPRLFALLQLARRIHLETAGAFDVTIAPLMRCWGFMGGTGQVPSKAQIDEARALVGMRFVHLDEKQLTIQFERPGMMLDLGSIGKGYALEVACESLVEDGITSGLIHGGTSTVCAIGVPPDCDAWRVAIDSPPMHGAEMPDAGADSAKLPAAVVELKDEAMSVSAIHGKSFEWGGKVFGHVLDPRTGYPAQSALLAAVVLPSATETDAFSTALLLEGARRLDSITGLRLGMRSLIADRDQAGPLRMTGRGICPLAT